MAQQVKDSFLDLERHRQLLEENTEKLRKSLRHWQMWEAEYEGLKEEILAVDGSDQSQLHAIANAYDGELVSKKEIEDILGIPKQRSAVQVVNLLDRRMDYVEQNVRTIQKQLEAAENKLAAASIISAPDIRNEEGLPMTEIIEELDEEGNIIASRTSVPGDATPQLLEALKKAGIKDVESISAPPLSPTDDIISSDAPDLQKTSMSESIPKARKKGVSFSVDTKPGPDHQKSKTAVRLEAITDLAKQQENQSKEPPIIPQNESAEDAALRREMLQYGMSEVGAVVAALQLEEASDWSDEDSEDGTSSGDEDEDAFGRSTGKLVDDELRQRMLELEERLGVRAMQNVGKDAAEYDIVQEGIGRVAIKGEEGVVSPKATPKKSAISEKNQAESEENSSSKKSVRFSEELDISAAPTEPKPPKPQGSARLPAPVGDVLERIPTAQSAPAPIQAKKPSRFKASRGPILNGPLASSNIGHLPLEPAKPTTPKPFSTPIQFSPATDSERTVPTGPQGAILAPQIIERDGPLNTATAPDELDPHLVNQEVATEYHKMRNRMIGKQGGFMKEEESEIVPFTEEEGGPKKMSRFKAARLLKS